jgi:hypothetical protein
MPLSAVGSFALLLLIDPAATDFLGWNLEK